ncbi:MAG TPA: regulatory protein RecX [Pseudonocardiaceae bacterium]|jgi:regulatory protein|nr:regulatory protein RecX [Pseudonocardiaceae bacterium]
MALPYRSRRGNRDSSGPEPISLISPSRSRGGHRSAPAEPVEPGAEEPAPNRERTKRAPADPVSAARDYCLNLLTARPMTRAELRKKLIGREYPEDVADQVLNRLHEVGLIDDAAVAEVWVRSRHNYQGMARKALSIELRRKGVADEVVAEAVSAVDADAEEARARELVRKRLRGTVPADEVAVIRRLVGMLARKGYSEGMAYRVVKSELRDFGAETDLLDTPPD